MMNFETLDFETSLIYISMGGGGFSLLLALGQLVSMKRSTLNWINALFFLILAHTIVSVALQKEYMLQHYPYLFAIHIPFYFLVPVLMRSYLLGIIDPQNIQTVWQPSKRSLRFPGFRSLIPMLIALLVMLPLYIASPEWKRMVILEPHSSALAMRYFITFNTLIVFALLSIIVVFVYTAIKLNIPGYLMASGSSSTRTQIRWIFLWFSLWVMLGSVGQVIDNSLWKRIAIAGISLGLFWIYLLEKRNPGFLQTVNREIKNRGRFANQTIEGESVSELLNSLSSLMEDHHVYVDEDLSLERLAAEMEVSPNRLSELLNRALGTDFRNYINSYRIEAAKKMLLEEPGRGIESIGLAVGFNSRASFHRNFKQFTGLSPGEFRQQGHAT